MYGEGVGFYNPEVEKSGFIVIGPRDLLIGWKYSQLHHVQPLVTCCQVCWVPASGGDLNCWQRWILLRSVYLACTGYTTFSCLFNVMSNIADEMQYYSQKQLFTCYFCKLSESHTLPIMYFLPHFPHSCCWLVCLFLGLLVCLFVNFRFQIHVSIGSCCFYYHE